MMIRRALLALATGAALTGAAAELGRAQAPNPCEQRFLALRSELEAKGKAMQAAGKRRVPPPEMCAHIRGYADVEAKTLKYVRDNQAACNIPQQLVEQVKGNLAKTVQLRTRVCNAAAQGAGAPPPASLGLSGALGTGSGGTPAATPGGSGVFDTLNGNILRQ
jgi:hypothetical protein